MFSSGWVKVRMIISRQAAFGLLLIISCPSTRLAADFSNCPFGRFSLRNKNKDLTED